MHHDQQNRQRCILSSRRLSRLTKASEKVAGFRSLVAIWRSRTSDLEPRAAAERIRDKFREIWRAFRDCGQIQIHCAARSGTFVIAWTERGGLPVTSPIGNTGFGDLLVRATVTGQLGGEISRVWKPEDLVIQLSVPRERLTGREREAPGESPHVH
jgi:hypothetical protein